jgi:hypothetical protein
MSWNQIQVSRITVRSKGLSRGAFILRKDLSQSAWVAVVKTVAEWSMAFYWVIYKAFDASYHYEWRYWQHKKAWLAATEGEFGAGLIAEHKNRDKSGMS